MLKNHLWIVGVSRMLVSFTHIHTEAQKSIWTTTQTDVWKKKKFALSIREILFIYLI